MPETRKKYSLVDYFIGYTFALAVIIAGTAAGYKGLEHVAAFIRTRAWIQVPAVIEESFLARSERTGIKSSTSFRAEARYYFDYAGKRYTGSRSSLSTGFDNVGSFQKNLAAAIALCATASNCQVWINPKNPAESMIDRSFRAGIVLICALISAGFLTFGIFCWRFISRAQTDCDER